MEKELKKGSITEKIYNFIIRYEQDKLYPPSISEIAEHTGLKSSSSVYNHLKKLESLKLIECETNCSRAIKLIGYKLIKNNQ